MRLINTSTLKLEEFTREIPIYAILSHTWGDEEVSFQLFQTPQRQSRAGFIKIRRFCALARSRKLKYAWVDTCCIDKSSSAELSEAINSMYSWYQKSKCCMVYLSDMHRCSAIVDEHERSEAEYEAFQACKWFTRGWCLQELLAPDTVIFYDQDWKEIGDKRSMSMLISRASGIKDKHLQDPTLPSISIAQKMSWAARRQTTRIEDEAYCLLGIFKVNMPLLYGEGSNAFMRLQQEIIKSSSDESIFVWTNEDLWSSGLLAKQPRDFAGSGDVIQNNYISLSRAPYSMTNQGLQIELVALQSGDQNARQFEGPLRCTRERTGKETLITLQLTMLGELEEKKAARRVMRTGLSANRLRHVTDLRNSTSARLCYVDDITCIKSLGSTETDLVWSHLDVSLSLGLRLRGVSIEKVSHMCQLHPIDTERIGFYIFEVNEEIFKVSAHYLDNALLYICWPPGNSSPTSMNIYCRNRNPRKKSRTQRERSINQENFNQENSTIMTVDLGNSLKTWSGSEGVSGSFFLFIALNSTTTPFQTKTIIDIEMKCISFWDPWYEQIVLSDPRGNYAIYRRKEGLFREPSFSSGDGTEIYGIPVRSLQSQGFIE